jgi:hypothetical protein
MKIFVFSLIYLINRAFSLSPTEVYDFSKILLAPDFYTLFWKHGPSEITFEIHFKDSKWGMFGLWHSNFSDVAVFWLNEDKTGHFSDRKLFSYNQLAFDSEQNWLPIDAFKKDGFTVFKFKRNIKVSCKNNSNEDLNIEPGLIPIVFSTGNNSDPTSVISIYQQDIELLTEKDGPYNCPIVPQKPELASTPADIYTNSFELVQGVYKIYWNYSNTEFIGEVHCKTDGWVAFGLSPNGGMDKSDVFVGWISNGQVNFTDRHIAGRKVLIDQNQDWILLKSSESNGVNVFKFKRNITSCDSEDLHIEKGSPYVIYAYSDADPVPGTDIAYHGSMRGSTKLNLISVADESPKQPEPNTEILDITIENLILPKQDTYYYCKGFQVPKSLTQKRHIYKYEFIFPKINYKSMHHALLYECRPGYDGENPKYEDGECYTSSAKGENCQAISIGWAVGGQESIYYPKDMGYPIGGDTDYSYLILELHYDNPQLDIGFIDKAILRFYMTTNLKPKELGILTLGADSSPYGIAIPAKADRFSMQTYCFNDCLNDVSSFKFQFKRYF